MKIKIDILRAICFTKDDIQTIKNLGDQFSEEEIEFMIEFKKIFELGVEQLEKFTGKLLSGSDKLSPSDIEYYVIQILNGPLSGYASNLRKYIMSDMLGVLGNSNRTKHNTTLYYDDTIPTNTNTDIYNKSPEFIQGLILRGTEITEKIFRSSQNSSMWVDNTLPIVDKEQQTRYSQERVGDWVTRPNATYNVKDSFYWYTMVGVRPAFFGVVEGIIEKEQYRIFDYKKRYSPFNDETNTSTSTIYEVKREIQEGEDPENKEIMETDLMGNVFDDRSTQLKIDTPEGNKEYDLHTVEGQYGD